MLNSKLYIGIDAGTQSVKAAVYDQDFKFICSHALPTTFKSPKPNWVEMDVDEFLNNAVTCIAQCVSELKTCGYDTNSVAAIMADGVICGICGVDAEGRAITPYINYLDSRTQADADAINAKKLTIWGRETGNAEASCMFPALFARWLLKNNEDMRRCGVKFVHNAPYLLMHLAGLKGKDAFIDWGALSGWGLGYKVEHKCWSQEQLKLLELDEKYLPRILKPWDIVGTLCPTMAAKTGLSTKVKICAGAGDTMQSMLGAGIFAADQGVDVAGTCAMFCLSTSGIVPELSVPGSGLIFNSGSLPDTYFYWGFVRAGGLSLRWFKDYICAKQDDPKYYQLLSKQAAQVPAGSGGVLFLPYLTGGSGALQQASGAFLNLKLSDNQAVMWRAVLEAIGYEYMEITDRCRAAGVALKRITVAEGGSRDDLWNQIKADMLQSRIVRYRNAGGALATNCVFAAYADGEVKDIQAALASCIAQDAEYQPDEDTGRRYRGIYRIKQQLLRQDLGPVFARLSTLNQTSNP